MGSTPTLPGARRRAADLVRRLEECLVDPGIWRIRLGVKEATELLDHIDDLIALEKKRHDRQTKAN